MSVSDTGQSQRHHAAMDPLIVAVFAAAVSLVGAARPSFWYDEAATISASYSRSLDQLWQMLRNVDAVHGLYYVLMHGWFQIFPPTEFWSRVPSGLAVGGAAAGVVVLGKQFSSRTVAVTSGVVCAILPRTTWAGVEARPYAMSMMAAVWLTVLLVVTARRDSRRLWLSYGAAQAMSVVLDLYLALLLLAHFAFLCVCLRTRTVLMRSAMTSALGGSGRRTVPGQGRRASASNQLGRADRAPNVRGCGGAAILRAKPDVRDVVGTRNCDGHRVVAFRTHRIGKPERQLLALAAGWLVIPTA